MRLSRYRQGYTPLVFSQPAKPATHRGGFFMPERRTIGMNDIVKELTQRLYPHLQEAWSERAAIMEFDGNLTVDYAEALALLCILKEEPLAISGVTLMRKSDHQYLLSTDARRSHLMGARSVKHITLSEVVEQTYQGAALLTPVRSGGKVHHG